MIGRVVVAFSLLLGGVARADFKACGLRELEAIDRRFGLPGGLFAGHEGDKKAASVWEAGVELSALNAAARLDPAWAGRAEGFAEALKAYRVQSNGLWAYRPFPGKAPNGVYFDDNEWLVLQFLETYELAKEKKYLTLAEETFAFVASGESTDLGGGIWWRDRRDSKNTCSNAPAICGALRLYQVTGEKRYLELAERVYAWVNGHFQDADGLYWDTLHLDGSIEKTKWSYNTAMMIRANLLLREVTGEERYLREAERVGKAAEGHWLGESDGAVKDPGPFGEMLCEALLYLSDADGEKGHTEKVCRALEALEKQGRDDAYPQWWSGWKEGEKLKLIGQASAARGFLVGARYRGK